MPTPFAMTGTWGWLLGASLSATLFLACSRKDTASNDSLASSVSSASAAEAASAARAPAALPPLTGLDSCLVGKWKASGVTLKADPVSAEGGAGVTLDIASSGASTLDFTGMAPVNATGRGFSFDFRYSGKASALVSSPTRGTLQAKDADYAGLRVSATVKLPGAGSIPLFKDKPMTELASMGAALAAGAGKGLPKGVSSGAAAGSGALPAESIESNPVFASNRYTCEGNALSFRGSERQFEWLFTRVAP